MSFVLLDAGLVEAIHEAVLNPGELAGVSRDRPLASALARVENRLAYGMVGDVFDLAAAYAVAIARGHCFHDANKRTAHQSMDVCLDLNGVEVTWRVEEIGPLIVRVAAGEVDGGDLAERLRGLAGRV